MTLVNTTQDADALTLTVVAELAAPPARVWQLWSDARQLERWWGPPTWPATFEEHDFVVGGRSAYVMTGPEGEKARGWWEFLALDEPRRLELQDGFADDAGVPNAEMPTMRVNVDLDLDPVAVGTRMTITSYFNDAEQLKQLVDMGMIEGMTAALGQIDAILAEG